MAATTEVGPPRAVIARPAQAVRVVAPAKVVPHALVAHGDAQPLVARVAGAPPRVHRPGAVRGAGEPGRATVRVGRVIGVLLERPVAGPQAQVRPVRHVADEAQVPMAVVGLLRPLRGGRVAHPDVDRGDDVHDGGRVNAQRRDRRCRSLSQYDKVVNWALEPVVFDLVMY